MVIVSAAIIWAGYVLVWYGRAVMGHGSVGSASGVGLADLAIPGHYVRTHGAKS